MKKIVGIIAGLALIAGFAFADEPDVTPTVSSFKGDASLEWVYDLQNETHGLHNKESTEFKIVFVPETKKATEGSDLWGDLEIKVGKAEIAAGAPVTLPTVSIEHAKIHFSEDDFYVRLNIRQPGLSLGGGKYVLATRSDDGAKANPAQSVVLTGKNTEAIVGIGGFTLEFGLKDTVDFNLQFADNGITKTKKYAFVFDASVKAVENLELVAGAGYSTEEEKFAIAAKASYKLGLTDTMYLRPSVGFAMKDKAKELGAALFFGWGAENSKAEFKSFSNSVVNIGDKCSDGVSFYLTSDLDKKYGFIFGVYDSTFVPGLKVGADFQADLKTVSDAWEFNAAAKYSNTFDIWTFDANFGIQAKNAAKKTNTGFLYGFGISTDNSIIQNTKLYANYSGEKAAKIGGADDKGKITIGTQIHF